MIIFDDTRADWSAAPTRGEMDYVAPADRDEYFVHYNGPALALPDHAACLKAVRAMQTYHQRVQGWRDIGYNALVCPHGRRIEGRGLNFSGGHCPNHNHRGYGVQAMIGKGQTPTPVMLAAIRRLYDELVTLSGPLTRMGHRDGYSTECPGPELYAWVKAGMPMPDGVTPTPAPKPTRPPIKPTPPMSSTAVLKRGSRGPLVTKLQAGLLRTFPSYAGPIKSSGGADGVFGLGTESVVKEFQRRVGIQVDGEVGPTTRHYLARYGIKL